MRENEQKYSPRWCLVGNIVKNHVSGEQKEMLLGTKQFQPGARVFVAPFQWGDGGEKVIVIGVPRHTKQYIEVIMQSVYITNYRLKRVYAPTILKKMEMSKFQWWGDTEQDKAQILQFVENSKCSFSEQPHPRKGVWSGPQAATNANIKNKISADMPRVKRRAF